MKVTSTRPDLGISSARRAGIGVGVAVGCSGVAFGAAAITAGLDVAQACVLSLFAFTGASQFALAGVVGGGGDLVAGTAGALLLGARNGLYGLRLAGPLGVRGLKRFAAAHAVIDETTAVATAQLTDTRADHTRDASPRGDAGPGDGADRAHRPGTESRSGHEQAGLEQVEREDEPAVEDRSRLGDGLADEAVNRRARAGFYATFVSLYIAWNLSTLAGAVGTSQVADPAVLGLDAVGPACFLALLWPRLSAVGANGVRAVAIGGAAIALVATPLLPPGIPVLLASVAALPAILVPSLGARRRAGR
ncbi:AzlC family ABC transporter permease [Thermopolyspora sp. NPDC052614]|uniref:AzlC family ABC transporter permease n=1 Tax=Thermopolyspora sp. NPDC052614 TaxID=3155682 RepID=UPI003419C1B3